MLSSEGVTQGDPLSMVLYGLALVPLAKYLRSEVPEVTSPFYADDSAFSGPVSKIHAAMTVLEKHESKIRTSKEVHRLSNGIHPFGKGYKISQIQ